MVFVLTVARPLSAHSIFAEMDDFGAIRPGCARLQPVTMMETVQAVRQGGAAMSRRFDFDGVVLEFPSRIDAASGVEIVSWPDFEETPHYTPEGFRIMLSLDGPCAFSVPAHDGRCLECGSCFHFQRIPGELIGTCRSPQRALRAVGDGEGADGPKEA